MELYIQIRNGQPFEHPIMGDNFREAFPHIDPNNLSPEFAVFVRKDDPTLMNQKTVFQKVNSNYVWENGYVTDSYYIRDMTEEEKAIELEGMKVGFDLTIQTFKEKALQKVEAETNAEYKQIWLDYVSLLDTSTFSYPDTSTPPAMPYYNTAGELLSVTTSGETPSVFG